MRVKKKSRPLPRPKLVGGRELPSASVRPSVRTPNANGALRTDVEIAAWLADGVLIAVASFEAEDRPLLVPTDPSINGAPPAPHAGWLTLEQAAPARKLVLAIVPGAAGASRRFSVNTPRKIVFDLAEKVTSLKTLLRTTLAGLDSERRSSVCAFAASATALQVSSDAQGSLGRSLLHMRDALRERLPCSEIAPQNPLALHIDWLASVDPQSFYVRGWSYQSERAIKSLVAVSPEGHRVELLPSLHRYAREDINQLFADQGASAGSGEGFVGFFRTPSRSGLRQGWVFEATDAAGASAEISAPAVECEPTAVRNSILGDLALEQHPAQEVIRRHLFPALKRLQDQFNAAAAAQSVEQYGQPPEAPDASVVVPLYRRIDFVEQQLAQFADDPQMHRADLIYVLDSPELADQLRGLAPRLHALYRVPFRVAVMSQSAGYSAANNVGVGLAQAPLLVLVNSDVIPDGPGWLGALAAFYRATPEIGALGPKLLYEDDSLQHAGMYFVCDPESREWGNWHYFKGMHRRLPAANVARPVPAVTGACLMIDTNLYRELGGLRGMFVQGDFEDSDLCLRLEELGRQNWYLPAVELYHLEGQSYPSQIRQMASRYNRWLQTELWRERIEQISAAPAIDAPTQPSQEFVVTAQLKTHPTVLLKELFDQHVDGVSREISPRDVMYNTDSADYFALGQKAVQVIKLAMLAAGKARVDRILDLPCGHGRVLRALRAAFPAADITACDLDRDAVDFCARTFGAVPAYSHSDPAQIPLTGGFDLIWCGSLLTHLGARRWPEFLRRFQSLLSPGGLLVFTTSGPWVARYLREGNLGLSLDSKRELLADYDAEGFGFREYDGQPGYGISVSSPAWVCSQLRAAPGLQLLSYTERGWGGFQDSVACVRVEVPAHGTNGDGAADGHAAASDWDQLRNGIRQSVARHVPQGAAVAVVSGGDEELLKCGGEYARHFPQGEGGVHAGHNPADSTEAAFHLAELCAAGVGYLLVPKPSLWWIDHYAEFGQHLESRHRLLVRDDSHALYALVYGVGLDASTSTAACREPGRAPELSDPLPPEELRFVGPGDFVKIGRDFLKIFVELGGLQPHHKVLDVGSGVGRMALPLTKYLKASGEYAGIEIVPAGVKWCVENITSRHPNFRFHHSDIYNAHYNPGGRVKAADYRFPFDNASFDFVFLTSVFTHMLPDDVRNYFSEISRVLRPGGTCLITYFLINSESIALMKVGKSTVGVPFERGIYRIADENVPEAVTAYDESFVLDLYAEFGLVTKRPLHYGNWCGRPNYVSYQDIIVASRP